MKSLSSMTERQKRAALRSPEITPDSPSVYPIVGAACNLLRGTRGTSSAEPNPHTDPFLAHKLRGARIMGAERTDRLNAALATRRRNARIKARTTKHPTRDMSVREPQSMKEARETYLRNQASDAVKAKVSAPIQSPKLPPAQSWDQWIADAMATVLEKRALAEQARTEAAR